MMVCIREFHFQLAVSPRNILFLNEVISKKESVPVFKVSFNHVDVMRSVPVFVTLDEPSIEGRSIIAPRWPPEVVISLTHQYGGDPLPGFIEACHLDQNVYDGFGWEARHSSAPKVLNSFDQIKGKAGQQMLSLPLKDLWPGRIVGDDGYLLLGDTG